jgi:Patatin-like phospholipase
MTTHPHDLAGALAAEYAAIHGAEPPITDLASYHKSASAIGQSALCLSGGGIRSAAFSLGVIQALARTRLLGQFDYLSTVSGGGFIGSWLSMLIAQKGSVAAAEDELRQGGAAPAVAALRDYTDYLTPHTGVLSDDTWAGIVLYIRNVLINWFAFLPVFLLAVLTAIFYRTLLWTISASNAAGLIALGIGAAGLLLSTWRVCRDLPSHRPIAEPQHVVRYLPADAIWWWITLPTLIWAFCVPMTLARWLRAATDGTSFIDRTWLPLVYVLAMLIGYWCAATARRAVVLYWRNFGAWLIATVVSGLALTIGLDLFGKLRLAGDQTGNQAEILAVLGPLWLVVANVLQSTIHVALRREARLGDLDREWLARLSATKLKVAAAWAVFAFLCLSLERLAFTASGDVVWPFWLVPIVTFISGPTAAWLGKQVFTRLDTLAGSVDGRAKLITWGLPLLSVLFAVGLFMLLGYLVSQALGVLQSPLPPSGEYFLLVQVVLGILLIVLTRHEAVRINVNRFSMHGVYRNRLTRAFLGAARRARAPDPFTGFDPNDNPRMTTLTPAKGPWKLFHVINAALNLTASGRTAWNQRKAAAFTITPLACGSPMLSPPGLNEPSPVGCYVPTGAYAGDEHESGRRDEPRGMSLATAMTISGAALSPNWGYHSSPVIAFLMTLFNVRLGAWLPNPAVVTEESELRRGYPSQGLAAMLHDLLGSTTDTTRAIYLSDGGHFDNLGLYEMLRRRCRMIVLVDAGEDPDCTFYDLGDSLRKSAIDQQIDVTFSQLTRIHGRVGLTNDSVDFAVGTIVYPEGGPSGQLIYLKPCYLADIPADVRAYGAANAAFPHETTLEQWFTESQFESYRHLGEHEMSRLIDSTKAPEGDLKALFKGVVVVSDDQVNAGSG